MSTDVAIDQIKSFLKSMGQPVDRAALQDIVLTQEQVQEKSRNISALALQEMEKEREEQIALGLKLRPDWHAQRQKELEEKNAETLADAERVGDEHDANRAAQLPTDADASGDVNADVDIMAVADDDNEGGSGFIDRDNVAPPSHILQERSANASALPTTINNQARKQLDAAAYVPYVSQAEEMALLERVVGTKRNRTAEAVVDMLLDED
jgi:hypothetical protein